jgi:hypothetical protein
VETEAAGSLELTTGGGKAPWFWSAVILTALAFVCLVWTAAILCCFCFSCLAWSDEKQGEARPPNKSGEESPHSRPDQRKVKAAMLAALQS